MDPVDLFVLGFNLVAHVYGHVAQVTDHIAHFTHVLLHLIFPGIVRYSTNINSSLISPSNGAIFMRHDDVLKPP